jgi:predicted CxxxxCH...CXXCH cytochrome family protein
MEAPMIKNFKHLLWFILPLLIWGCGSDVNPDFTPFGGQIGYHPFPDPPADNHGSYLTANNYDFTVCAGCHGQDLNNPSNSCYVCHTSSNHIVFFTHAVSAHPGYLLNHQYNLDDCYNCHGGQIMIPEAIRFGGSCSNSNCHSQGQGPEACNTCHGNFDGSSGIMANWGPPENLAGDTATTVLTVGAHQPIVQAGGDFAAITCINCHRMPSVWNSPGHIGGTAPYQAEVVFDFIAVEEDADPVWNRTQATCSNTYCHFDAEPVWTQVDGTWSSCGSCHTLPPGGEHPSWPTINDCHYCHYQTIDADGNIINPSLHCNGEADD